MGAEKFNIVFRGKLAAGFEQATVQANFARLFKKDESRIAPLFAGGRQVLKRGLDRATADKYRTVLRNAGAIVAVVQIVERAQTQSAPPPASPAVGTEVKANYAGRASFDGDKGQPPSRDATAAGAADGAGPSAVAGGQARTDDAVEPPPVAGVVAPVGTADLQGQSAATNAAAKIDTAALSLVGDGPVANIEGRANYAVDAGPKESAGLASFAIDDRDPNDPESEDDGESDDFAPLEMPSWSGAETSQAESQLTDPIDPPEIDISGFTMSEVGVIVDETERPPAASIDTGDLAAEENFDILDASPRVPAPEIDTFDLDVMDLDITVDDSERPPPVDIDTSGLSSDLDYEGLDQTEMPAAPDIDISQLGLQDDR